jgi:glycine/D-amino acid oxidase-like deaminating enzyme
MQSTADVVIIGAGVIGCSTAYHLAQLGITDVAVVEMDQVGSGSSGKSASMLSLQYCEDELAIQMTKYSYARYMQFEGEMGVPIDFKKIGWMSVASEKNVEPLRRNAELLNSHGITTEILEPDEIKRRYPEINTEDLVLGTWGPDDGLIDPHMVMWGYMKKAQEMGATLHQGVKATGIEVHHGKVEGVRTGKGVIWSRTVMNAGGPWAKEIGRWVDVEIPIMNLARTIVVTGPFADIPNNRPFLDDMTLEWYGRPELSGLLMGMGAKPVEEPHIQTDTEMVNEIIDVAVRRIPVLEKASMQTAWTGIRPLTPDGYPIIGPVPSVGGLILNCGWGGRGIIQAPIAGRLVAETICNGYPSTMDIRPLEIERFKGTFLHQ